MGTPQIPWVCPLVAVCPLVTVCPLIMVCPLLGDASLCSHALNSAFRLCDMDSGIRARQAIGVGQWTTNGSCLRYAGMHGVPH
jgi:hypothetical protein